SCLEFNTLLTIFSKKVPEPEAGSRIVESSNEIKFDEQFKILERGILLSSSFNYLLLIPTFGAKFPVGEKKFVLDSDHILRDITGLENPYNIPSFKETPKYWKRYYSDKVEQVLEVNFSLEKRLSNNQPYEKNMTPSYPTSSFGRDIFNEKLIIIIKLII
ncbi:hypothetical protein LCGC14_1000540, partial [marine sediment metagenome]